MVKEETRLRIIEVGADLIHLQGFNNTGIQQILKAAKVPKGSFYFYFENKEDFGLQLIDHLADSMEKVANQFLEDSPDSPLLKLRRLYEMSIRHYQDFGFTRGCPFGNLSQEMADINPAFRQKLEDVSERMIQFGVDLLSQAQERGELSRNLDPGKTQRFINAAWQGAILKMKLVKNADPLELFLEMVFDHLLVK